MGEVCTKQNHLSPGVLSRVYPLSPLVVVETFVPEGCAGVMLCLPRDEPPLHVLLYLSPGVANNVGAVTPVAEIV